MSLSREAAGAFVESYGKTWEAWDVNGFVNLFSDAVVYVAHPTEETVAGKEALTDYVRKEESEQGSVSVKMGRPIIDGDHLAAEFWVTATNPEGEGTIAGCLIARLDADGRCAHFREYWFDLDGHTPAFDGWGE